MPQRRINRRVVGSSAAATAVGAAVFFLPQAPAFGDVSAGPLAQATSTPGSPQSPQVTPTPRPLRFYPTAAPFVAYYNRIDGLRVLGQAISPLTLTVDQKPAQYFEKARLEDRTGESPIPEWQFAYGLLVDEMKNARSLAPVGGDRSTVNYATIDDASNPARRVPPPAGFTGNVAIQPNGSVFIPFTTDLSPAPGHVVPPYFWEFMNRTDLFPGGWLHDIGLPITPELEALVDKGVIIGTDITRVFNRPIRIQAFQRTILTYDPQNPPDYLTERANTGTDYWAIFPERVPQ